ncbi:MAG: hypothetical protein CL927_17490 [Deltaproteobacteria bacterium]|nr:hypothetical protein [Deltaproteobacteria bacterium]HCH66197.1 hypothetical protein [Deltaproteobacteria bacterium]
MGCYLWVSRAWARREGAQVPTWMVGSWRGDSGAGCAHPAFVVKTGKQTCTRNSWSDTQGVDHLEGAGERDF